MDSSKSTVVLETFSSVHLAGLAKAKLDAFGIPCIILNEDIANLYPLPFGSVRLVVLEDDAKDAKRILEEAVEP